MYIYIYIVYIYILYIYIYCIYILYILYIIYIVYIYILYIYILYIYILYILYIIYIVYIYIYRGVLCESVAWDDNLRFDRLTMFDRNGNLQMGYPQCPKDYHHFARMAVLI